MDTFEPGSTQEGYETEYSRLNVDWYWDVPERHGLLARINYKGVILNGIRQIYRVTGGIAGAAGFLAWLYLSVCFIGVNLTKIRNNRKKTGNMTGIPENTADECRKMHTEESSGPERLTAQCLVLTSLLFSYLVLLGGISYSEISGWNAILYWYLSGAYPVMAAFEILSVLFFIQRMKTGR